MIEEMEDNRLTVQRMATNKSVIVPKADYKNYQEWLQSTRHKQCQAQENFNRTLTEFRK